jgi:hypothetical protein
LGGYDFVFERNLVREARLIGVAIKQNHGLKKQISCTISTILHILKRSSPLLLCERRRFLRDGNCRRCHLFSDDSSF